MTRSPIELSWTAKNMFSFGQITIMVMGRGASSKEMFPSGENEHYEHVIIVKTGLSNLKRLAMISSDNGKMVAGNPSEVC